MAIEKWGNIVKVLLTSGEGRVLVETRPGWARIIDTENKIMWKEKQTFVYPRWLVGWEVFKGEQPAIDLKEYKEME